MARSTAAGSSPPTMIASSPVRALGTPPDTGASTRAIPRSFKAAPSSAVPCGDDELMSISKEPIGSVVATPFSPSTAARTTWTFGSMVITTLARPPTSAGEVARPAPKVAASSSAAADMSKATTEWPASQSRRAIGRPIFPRPMNPIDPWCPRASAGLMASARERAGPA